MKNRERKEDRKSFTQPSSVIASYVDVSGEKTDKYFGIIKKMSKPRGHRQRITSTPKEIPNYSI